MYLAAKPKRKDDMNIQQQTQNVAAQGRYGDTMLMHVNPLEVESLAQVAPVTINPQTGQPEAFLFLAPLLGSLLGPAAFSALGLGGVAGGALTGLAGSALGSGLAQWAATGDFKKGLLAGVTGYGIGSALQGAGAAAQAGQATKAATDLATTAGSVGSTTTQQVLKNVGTQATQEGIKSAATQTPLQNLAQVFRPGSMGSVGQISPTVGAAGSTIGDFTGAVANPTLGESLGYLATGASQPVALAATAAGMAPTAIMDSQEQYAADLARMQEEEEASRMQNFLMNPEPILYTAQGGTTNFDEGGSTEIDSTERFLRMMSPAYSLYKTGDYLGLADSGMLGMMPQLLGPDGLIRGRNKQEEPDESTMMDANLAAQAMTGPSSNMMMAAGGGRVGYRRGGRGGARGNSSESPDTSDNTTFAGDYQRFTPARQTYDINPNFMPGFQPETMYFSPATINAPASMTQAGSAPTFEETYAGTKGGYNMPGMAVAPQTTIDPYEAYAGLAPEGLRQTEVVTYPGDVILDEDLPSQATTTTTNANASTNVSGMSPNPALLNLTDFQLDQLGRFDSGMEGIRPDLMQRGMEGMDFYDVRNLGQLPNPIIEPAMDAAQFNITSPGLDAGPRDSIVNTPQLLTDAPNFGGQFDPRLSENLMNYNQFLTGGIGVMAGGGETDLPNKGLEALNKVAPDVVERMGFDDGGGTGETLIQESNRYKNYYLKGNTESFKDYSPKENVDRYIRAQKSILNKAKTTEQKQAIQKNIQSHINTPIDDFDPSMGKLSGNELFVKMKKSLLPEEYKSQKDRFEKAFENKKQAGGRTNFDAGGTTNIMEDPITQETIQFIMGETDNQQVINEFIAKYGNEVFLELRNTVLKSLVPNAQTEGLIQGKGLSGMADDIPGRIGAEEKIAVSQDEFIVPADVVSALGDGSSDAGSNALYNMMDRVRQAKTGGTTQPPMINLSQVMPA